MPSRTHSLLLTLAVSCVLGGTAAVFLPPAGYVWMSQLVPLAASGPPPPGLIPVFGAPILGPFALPTLLSQPAAPAGLIPSVQELLGVPLKPPAPVKGPIAVPLTPFMSPPPPNSGVCGDGVVQPGQSCDDGAGNGTGPGACNTACTGFVPCPDGSQPLPDGINAIPSLLGASLRAQSITPASYLERCTKKIACCDLRLPTPACSVPSGIFVGSCPYGVTLIRLNGTQRCEDVCGKFYNVCDLKAGTSRWIAASPAQPLPPEYRQGLGQQSALVGGSYLGQFRVSETPLSCPRLQLCCTRNAGCVGAQATAACETGKVFSYDDLGAAQCGNACEPLSVYACEGKGTPAASCVKKFVRLVERTPDMVEITDGNENAAYQSCQDVCKQKPPPPKKTVYCCRKSPSEGPTLVANRACQEMPMEAGETCATELGDRNDGPDRGYPTAFSCGLWCDKKAVCYDPATASCSPAPMAIDPATGTVDYDKPCGEGVCGFSDLSTAAECTSRCQAKDPAINRPAFCCVNGWVQAMRSQDVGFESSCPYPFFYNPNDIFDVAHKQAACQDSCRAEPPFCVPLGGGCVGAAECCPSPGKTVTCRPTSIFNGTPKPVCAAVIEGGLCSGNSDCGGPYPHCYVRLGGFTPQCWADPPPGGDPSRARAGPPTMEDWLKTLPRG